VLWYWIETFYVHRVDMSVISQTSLDGVLFDVADVASVIFGIPQTVFMKASLPDGGL
jgi:hypothetical protein